MRITTRLLILTLPLTACEPAPTTLRPELTGTALSDAWTLDGSGAWLLEDGALVLAEAGVPDGPFRRPAALALLDGPSFGDVVLEAEVRSTAAPDNPRGDVLLIFGYRSPSEFYYAHLSGVTDDVHNGIFVVDHSDRRRIDDGTAAPQLTDRSWHRVRMTRNAATGRIEVAVDEAPGLVATDTTFRTGHVGFGSFDDTALFRAIVATGTEP